MDVEYSSTNDTSQQSYNTTLDMHVVTSTSTYYKVNVTASSSAGVFGYLFKVETSGTVDWAFVIFGGNQINDTNSAQATASFVAAFAPFELEAGTNQAYGYSLLTQYFHQVGGTNTLLLFNAATSQSTQIDYKLYEANSSGESFSFCGSSFTFTEFSVEIGTIHNTSVQVLAHLHIKGSENGNQVDAVVNLSWVLLAS